MNLSIRLHPLSLLAGGCLCAGFLLLASMVQPSGDSECGCLSPEQRRILERMSLVRLEDGQGGSTPTIRFTGVNVQVVNGLGATNGYPQDPNSIDPVLTTTNSVGNLIVGYNELGNGHGDVRFGSHNVVVGRSNNHTSFGGLVLGEANGIHGAYSAVTGGRINLASGDYSSVNGGDSNEALGIHAAVLGGEHNIASGFATAVVGGFGNEAAGDFSAVSGGANNFALASSSSVSGGASNLALGDVSSVGGGVTNTAAGLYSSISGGEGREVHGDSDWQAGGLFQDD